MPGASTKPTPGNNFRGGAGKRPAQSYKDFYNQETGVVKPEISRTGAGVKPAVTKAPGSRPIPGRARNKDIDPDEKADAIRRRLRLAGRMKKSSAKVNKALKTRR